MPLQFVSQGPLLLPVAPSGDVTTGLVAYWPMQDGSGTTFVDTVAGRNGTLSSSSIWSGGNILWDGTEYGYYDAQSPFNATTAMTLFCWIKAAAQSATVWGRVNFTGPHRFWQINIGVTGRFSFAVADISSEAVYAKAYTSNASYIVADDTWHSIAVRFNTGVLDLFKDGVIDSSPTKSTDNTMTEINHDVNVFMGFGCYIDQIHGFDPAGAQGGNMVGNSRKYRFYNVAKTDADIAAMHALG